MKPHSQRVTATTGEPITLSELIEYLGAGDVERVDTLIDQCLQAGRERAENWIARTLRPTVTRVLTYTGFESPVCFPWPPLLAVSTVKYYDVDGNQQTIASSNYYVHLSTDGEGALTFDADYNFPITYDNRPDVVEYTITTGYTSQALIPAAAKVAVKMFAKTLYDGYGEGPAANTDAYILDAQRLLDSLRHGVYA